MRPIPQPHCSLETVEVTLPLPTAHPGQWELPFPIYHFPHQSPCHCRADQCGSAEPSQLICLQILDHGKLSILNGDTKQGHQRLTQGHNSVSSLKHLSISHTTCSLHA